MLEADGVRIKVRPRDKIKLGEEWGWVDVEDVDQFHQGPWYVSVRNVWRATHRERPAVPDWKRACRAIAPESSPGHGVFPCECAL